MTCSDCQAATADPKHAGYRSGCKSCEARAMANSPLFFDAQRSAARFAEYRAKLIELQLRHGDVKAASARMKGATA